MTHPLTPLVPLLNTSLTSYFLYLFFSSVFFLIFVFSITVPTGVESLVFVGQAGGVAASRRLGEQVLRPAETVRPPVAPRRQDYLLRRDVRVQQPRPTVCGSSCLRSQGQAGPMLISLRSQHLVSLRPLQLGELRSSSETRLMEQVRTCSAQQAHIRRIRTSTAKYVYRRGVCVGGGDMPCLFLLWETMPCVLV